MAPSDIWQGSSARGSGRAGPPRGRGAMVPGLSERDAGAAELRQGDLLADAARERQAGAGGTGGLSAGVALP